MGAHWIRSIQWEGRVSRSSVRQSRRGSSPHASILNCRTALIRAAVVESSVVDVDDDPDCFLGADDMIQSSHPSVEALAGELRANHAADTAFARTAFEWVRDNVSHSFDVQDARVTLTASEVLEERVGLCYAKSNLLAAVLRSQGIPAALCYQRLGNPDEGYFVHGLVAIHLDGAWHRQDPRGNKPGVDAQFSLGRERLAWEVDESRGERDYPRLYPTTAPEVTAALRNANNILTCSLPTSLQEPGAAEPTPWVAAGCSWRWPHTSSRGRDAARG